MKKINMASGKAFAALAVLAAAFTMASCSREQLIETENSANSIKGNCIITAFTENSLNDNTTRTALKQNDETGKYDVVWSEGDKIKIGDNEFTLIDGATTTSGKFQGTLPTDGTHTAYYPATYNGTWPTSQTYTANNITGSPMTADVTVSGGKVLEKSLSFTNAGGILRLTVKGTATIKAIKINAVGLNEITLNCGNGIKLDNTNGTVFHIAMPEGNHSGVSIYFRATDDNYCFKKLKQGTTLDIIKSQITPASFTVSFPSSDSTAPLTGVFSVSASKKVCFSKGNLYYDDGFKFESKQYEFHGYDSGSNTWGLFGWSTYTSTDDDITTNNYGMSTSGQNSDYSGEFYDWGNAFDDNGTWRTLSKDEWVYLLGRKNGEAYKYGYATVYGTKGLIILPDEFTDPMKNGGNGAFVPGPESGWSSNNYSIGGNWEAMESAGAVFLPAALYRGEKEIMKINDMGCYWSSSDSDADAGKAYYMDFIPGGVHPEQCYDRRFGFSVRLVTDAPTGKAYAVSPDCEVTWVQLWENGPKFAEYNVGATSATDYGGYYCWGGTIDKDSQGRNSDKSAYSFDIQDDIAYNLWGNNWRLPTLDEINYLLQYCTCTWVKNYNGTGVNGILCKGKEGIYSSFSIFLPAAGQYNHNYDRIDYQSNYGFYWTNSLGGWGYAYALTFYPEKNIYGSDYRSRGNSVRAVLR